eukprot:TRINITY_DN10327_c1_g1_i1.p1 TRINITY_DN10327_c1_g1~~TRINITY_DN10327_c1_g1_i1.p1  ORF type:complete len:196 (-),score=-9.42 TRINITY_DN10327_c1_g1_i1:330-917(-)
MILYISLYQYCEYYRILLLNHPPYWDGSRLQNALFYPRIGGLTNSSGDPRLTALQIFQKIIYQKNSEILTPCIIQKLNKKLVIQQIWNIYCLFLLLQKCYFPLQLVKSTFFVGCSKNNNNQALVVLGVERLSHKIQYQFSFQTIVIKYGINSNFKQQYLYDSVLVIKINLIMFCLQMWICVFLSLFSAQCGLLIV